MLITTSSPGNEGTPVGYRANDGTDSFNTDQAFPVDANGLLFDVNTTTAKWGAYPLFTIWSNTPQAGYSAAFTGVVDGAEYYNFQGSAMVSNAGTFSSAVPEHSTWAMHATRLCGLGPRWLSDDPQGCLDRRLISRPHAHLGEFSDRPWT